MRDIKFRAWDENFRGGTMREFSLGETLVSEQDRTIDFNSLQVMQYTGLKDKNGREIYEGDIILDCLTMARYEIKFGFCKRYAYNGWYGLQEDRTVAVNADYDTTTNNSVEVIGNIYENPELIQCQQSTPA